MKRVDIRFVAEVLKKATAVFTGTDNRKAVIFTTASINRSARGSVCRTPADSAILRINAEPWA
jgi:hypothetical protein